MDTEALAIGAPLELSRTSTEAALLKPAGTNPGGTVPVGKLIREALIEGATAEEPPPPPPLPPPPPQLVTPSGRTIARAVSTVGAPLVLRQINSERLHRATERLPQPGIASSLRAVSLCCAPRSIWGHPTPTLLTS